MFDERFSNHDRAFVLLVKSAQIFREMETHFYGSDHAAINAPSASGESLPTCCRRGCP